LVDLSVPIRAWAALMKGADWRRRGLSAEGRQSQEKKKHVAHETKTEAQSNVRQESFGTEGGSHVESSFDYSHVHAPGPSR